MRELIDWSERVAAEKRKWAEHRARARRRGAQQAQLGAIAPALSSLCRNGRRPARLSSVMSLALADFLAKGVLKRQPHREERVTLLTAKSQNQNLEELSAAHTGSVLPVIGRPNVPAPERPRDCPNPADSRWEWSQAW
mgnify:CR=1 FL=1